jgi:transcriptional regulator with XRE-family HTH domain
MGSPASVKVERAGLVVVLSADAVRVACAERGWSLSELARLAKISRPTLASALRGRPVRSRTAWKLARALEERPQSQLSQLLEPATLTP